MVRRSLLAVAALVVAACTKTRPVHLDVRYDERFEEDTSMDVYEPGGVGPHPAVMMIHGGAWIAGSKEEYTEAAKRLARSGFVAATINYRLAPDGEYPKIVQDCLCALSYLRANASQYHVDPDRVAVMGYSAGGHLGTARSPAWPRASGSSARRSRSRSRSSSARASSSRTASS